MKSTFHKITLLFAGSILTASLVRGQQSVNYGSVSGRVTDPSGAVVRGAEITARQIDTNQTSAAQSDADGRFRFPYLRVGPYRIEVRHEGFTDALRSLMVTAGSAFDVPVALTIASAQTEVTVGGQVEVLEEARSQIAATVPHEELDNLPLNGRSFLDAALLAPDISPTNTASTQLFAETSAVPGQGLSLSSQRNFSNGFIVDGLSANDDAAGLSETFFALDVIEDVQVVTSGGQAEFGRAMGGYINLVTRSGTNTLHGDLYGYLRNQRLNANNALLGAKLPMTQTQFGASLGGPIVRDRTFYFSNYEERDLNQSGLITIAPASVAVINAALALDGYRGAAVSTGIYPNPVHLRSFLAKTDHQFTAGDQFSVRYSLYDVDSDNSRGAGGLSTVSAAAGLNDLDSTVAVSNIASLSAHTVNETRGQFTYSSLMAPVNDAIGPAVSISGVAAFGTLSASPTARLNQLAEVADNLTHQQGAHALRVGVDFLFNATTIDYPRSIRGSYSFASLASFLSGAYNNAGYTQTFGNSVIAQNNPNVGFYAQDEWKVAPRFTFNLGVRYDLQFLQTIATQTNNISPRSGFAWTPFRNRRTVVRGGFGLFYDRIPLRALANALLSAGNTATLSPESQISVSLSPAQTGAPMFPGILSVAPAGPLVNLTTMDPHLQHAYSEQGSLEIEQQIGRRGTLSVGYQHLRGRHLIISVNQNVPTCVAAGANNGCRPNPDFANDSQYSSRADSQYDGAHVTFVERPVAWGSVRISYTFSKALDDVSEFFFSGPMNNFDIRQDWGRSDDDQRHRVTLDGTLHTPMGKATTAWGRIRNGFELSWGLQYYSAPPFNIVTGANTVQGTAARPTAGGVVIGRNLGTGFDLFNVNLRLSRTFTLSEHGRLQALAEAFNALNHTNDMVPNGTFGSGLYPSAPQAAFGQPTAVGDPRGVQVALRLSF